MGGEEFVVNLRNKLTKGIFFNESKYFVFVCNLKMFRDIHNLSLNYNAVLKGGRCAAPFAQKNGEAMRNKARSSIAAKRPRER